MHLRTCRPGAAGMLLVLAAALPALGQVPDIEVRLIPTLTPGTSTVDPDPSPNTLVISPDDSFSVEFWISDISAGGSAVTGIASAYIDLAWNEPAAATADALVTTGNHPSPFTLLADDGVIDNASNTVTNFGALDGSFSGPGNNTFVLFGWYDFLAGSGLGDILFSATEGSGEIAPFNRVIEPGGVAFNGATVTVFEADCNDNDILDECDIDCGAPDCNVPGCGESDDCNTNGIPDECEIDQHSSAPGGPFFCATDCDPDCNSNGIPDECDIDSGTSPDQNGNGVPDECDECLVNGDCDDGLFCNGDESCDAGQCEPGAPVDCDDGVGCTVDSCDEVNDVCLNVPDDGLCDDLNVCTDDTCDPVNDCEYASNTAPCDDGLWCTVNDTCSGGTCSDTSPRDCGDSVDCTVDTCDEANDTCVNAPDDGLCDNGEFCDGAEICDADTGCLPGSEPCVDQAHCDEDTDTCLECLDNGECDDGVVCTVDTCVNESCVFTPDDANCPDDGVFCNGTESCDAQQGCVSSGDPCVAQGLLCNEVTDTCDECEADDDCDDSVACTDDTCVGGGCVFTPNDTGCDDGLFCTGSESCDAQQGCVTSGNPCQAGEFCNETTDKCDQCRVDDDCDDELFCTGVEACSNGVCLAGSEPCPDQACDEDKQLCFDPECDTDGDCDDGDVCTTDACVNKRCVNTPIAGCADTDDDGVADAHDDCPDTESGAEVDGRGCDDAHRDDDGDGVNNRDDACRSDRGKVEPGVCGCGTPDTDTDGDGVPDCIDGTPNRWARSLIVFGPDAVAVGETVQFDAELDFADGEPEDVTDQVAWRVLEGTFTVPAGLVTKDTISTNGVLSVSPERDEETTLSVLAVFHDGPVDLQGYKLVDVILGVDETPAEQPVGQDTVDQAGGDAAVPTGLACGAGACGAGMILPLALGLLLSFVRVSRTRRSARTGRR